MTARQRWRLAGGGRIDRTRPLRFKFNGRELGGFAGDTLASALLANGVRTVARSFKYHRRRGILSAGVEEPHALLAVDSGNGEVPLLRATTVPLIDGLRAATSNCFPSAEFDFGRVLDYSRALWPAGFYNKTFKWPSWHAYEWAMRRASGLGRLPSVEDTAKYCHRNAHCDVLVVGAGPSGLQAALAAARQGVDVILVEQDVEAGGRLLYGPVLMRGGMVADDAWRASALRELGGLGNVELMLRTTASGYYDHNIVGLYQSSAAGDAPETFWKIRAGRVILATGAIEQPLLFGNNDLPGVMLADAMYQYARRYGVRCASRVAAVVNNDVAWRSLLGLHDAGVAVGAIVDARKDPRAALRHAANERGIAVHAGARPLRALGRRQVTALEFYDSEGAAHRIECDGIAMSSGLNPTVHLYSQAAGRLRYDGARECFLPDECRQAVDVVGAANGDFAASGEYNIAPRDAATSYKSRQWVDYLHDVTASDVELAVRENYVSVEHMKRYTTCGMAADQGKTSNLNALTLLGRLTGRHPGDVGTTTFRPQFTPVPIAALAGNRRGELYAPSRRLAAHQWHAEAGAVFEDYGEWRRPAWYGPDRDAAVEREVRRVRTMAGLFDASPLGKIEVKGAHAARFLDFIYVNTMSTLRTGRVRYGVMLTENGIVFDDGVVARLAGDHFLVNTTSSGVGRVMRWLEDWRQCEFPSWRLVMTDVTSQWAAVNVAGPMAASLLESVLGGVDLSREKFPHMSIRSGELDGMAYRLQRVSFSGEQSFELSVPATAATGMFKSFMKKGESRGLGLFGVEALMVLRLEKGFLHVGVDTDGTTNALDIGMGRIVEKKAVDFVGARSLARPGDRSAGRRQLVGFVVEGDEPVAAGAHFVAKDEGGLRSEGFVTSACRSPTLQKQIGLGLLERGRERLDENIGIYDAGNVVSGRIVDACFYDPAGERLYASESN